MLRAEVNLQKQRQYHCCSRKFSGQKKNTFRNVAKTFMVTFRTLLNATFQDEVMTTSDPDPGAATSCSIFRSVLFSSFSREQFTLTSDAPNASPYSVSVEVWNRDDECVHHLMNVIGDTLPHHHISPTNQTIFF
jgi:hypothetical protein